MEYLPVQNKKMKDRKRKIIEYLILIMQFVKISRLTNDETVYLSLLITELLAYVTYSQVTKEIATLRELKNEINKNSPLDKIRSQMKEENRDNEMELTGTFADL